MNIAELLMGEFWTYAGQTVRFQPGLTLVTGKNGAGKTALAVDGPAWVLWGQTVRGAACAGDVTATFVDGPGNFWRVWRSRKTKKSPTLLKLELKTKADGGWDDKTGQTPSETQAEIERVFGSWERHCATRVFSVRLAARFGSATDKERKALLESILGLERFEKAAALARAATKEQRDELARRREAVAAAEAEVAQARRMITALPAEEDDPAAIAEAHELAVQRLADTAAQVDEVEARFQDAIDRNDRARALFDQEVRDGRDVLAKVTALNDKIAGARAREKKALELGECPVCLTPGDKIDRARIGAATTAEIAPWKAELVKLEPRLKAHQAEAMSLKEDVAALAKTRDAARAESTAAHAARNETSTLLNAARAALAKLQGRQDEERRLRGELGAAGEKLATAAGRQKAAAVALTEGEAAVEVLGSKGARVRMLDSALAEVSVYANNVLRRLGSAMTLKIQGTRKQATGKEVDEVSVVVEGAGGGEYVGTSDGEKARVDLAILLGLATVAGERDGLIVFDEVFDPLDDDGLEGVSELLEEMARERQVLVVTHSPRFTGIVTSDHRFHVDVGAAGSVVTAA